MSQTIEKIKQYKSEIALAALYIYVVVLAFATMKEFGIF